MAVACGARCSALAGRRLIVVGEIKPFLRPAVLNWKGIDLDQLGSLS